MNWRPPFAIALLIVAWCRCTCSADEFKPVPDTISTKIVLPMTPVLVEPDAPPAPQPVPQPTVEPRVVTAIPFDCWWVIESQEELFVDQVPEGMVNVENWSSTPEEKSVRMMGRFADGLRDAAGNLKTETRVYRSPFVYFVTAKTKGQTTIIIDPRGMLDLSQRVKVPMVITDGPRPPPDPDVDPKPPDPPGPIVPGKLQVLVIEDTTKTTAQQANILDSAAFRHYIDAHCSSSDGSRDYLKISALADVADQEQWVKTAFAKPRTSLPFIVIMSPTKEASGPLPQSIDETLKALKMLGGE